ncbi:dihydrolipoamide acetyltransferase family protein [Cellulomonas fimi]|uniref:Dihydrolipoamide acetyltransferase component of pyruvate dehydrogenase complex n=1 Tax=Cellulomonas fimi TaxID=1708 RepID=A0A7Y0M0X5_CELFI|nr:dihydrolipoamide acetyltransferase family protein [Cellulomonas fimi]NMR21394.1 2-oxo acid dehydrogenase subunit E2 [Cellulomonas fimi]
MTVKEFAMPDLGEGLTESELVSWSVAVGDWVELNQVIAEVETAKALVQVPSPFAGVVSRLFVEPGTTVLVGAPIIAVEVADDEAPGQDGSDRPGDGQVSPTRAEPAPERNAVLVGYGAPVESASRPRRRARDSGWVASHRALPAQGRSTAPTPAPPSPPASTADGGAPSRTGVGTTPVRPRSYPPVRKLAHEHGINLATVTGTGPDGVITREDVLAAVAARGDGTTATPPEPAPRTAPREVRTPITGVRKHTAAAMVASAFTAPHATEFLTVDVTPTVELLETLAGQRRFEGHRITLLTLVAKALTIAVRRNPTLNSRWDEAAGEIVQHGYVNLGIAAATPRGLLVPHVKDAQDLDLVTLADAIGHLTQEARAGRTPPADLVGGTISITNIGVFGVDAGTPILNPGEAAILAMGAVRRQPWEHRGEVALRSVLTLSLSFDHRVVDGEQASRFLTDVGAMLAEPGMTLTMV